MNEQSTPEYFTVPDLVGMFNSSPGKIHRLIEQRHLAAVRVDGVLRIPALFIDEGEPLHSLHGTLTLLHDVGFSNDEAVNWMLEERPELGTSPIAALRAGRKSEVRRIAQSLAF